MVLTVTATQTGVPCQSGSNSASASVTMTMACDLVSNYALDTSLSTGTIQIDPSSTTVTVNVPLMHQSTGAIISSSSCLDFTYTLTPRLLATDIQNMVTLDQTAVPATITIDPSAYSVADLEDGTYIFVIGATETTTGTVLSTGFFLDLELIGFVCEKVTTSVQIYQGM